MEASEKSMHDRLNEIDWKMLSLRTERSRLSEMVAADAFMRKIEEFKELQAKLIADARIQFPSVILPIMNRSERIQSMAWRQYANYFNDGDPCTFSVRHYDIDLNGVSHYESQSEGLTDEDWELANEMEKVMKTIPDEVYEKVFGDHAEITISKNGTISVSEFNRHD